jgi:hypothetical protein
MVRPASTAKGWLAAAIPPLAKTGERREAKKNGERRSFATSKSINISPFQQVMLS